MELLLEVGRGSVIPAKSLEQRQVVLIPGRGEPMMSGFFLVSFMFLFLIHFHCSFKKFYSVCLVLSWF